MLRAKKRFLRRCAAVAGRDPIVGPAGSAAQAEEERADANELGKGIYLHNRGWKAFPVAAGDSEGDQAKNKKG